jgi:ABC-type glycerol-3-phosphate transport system substrate-binding protein
MNTNRKKLDRRIMIAVAAAVVGLAAAAALVATLVADAEPTTLKLLAPFKEGEQLAAFRSEIKEFELREKRVSVEIVSEDYSEIDRITAPGTAEWDAAIGSARLDDGRTSVERPAVPLYGSRWLLFYNRSVLEKAGISPSVGAGGLAGRLAAGTATVSDLRDACAAAARAGARPIALGSRYGWPLAVWIEALMAAEGSAADAGRLIESGYDLESPALAAAVGEFKSLAAAGFVDPAHSSKDWPVSLRELVAGKAAFCLLGEELAASLPASEQARIGRLPLPGSVGADGRSWVIGSVSYIARRSGLEGRARREAAALVSWLTSEGASERLTRRLGTAFFAGGKGPRAVIPSISASPSGAVVSRIVESVAAR